MSNIYNIHHGKLNSWWQFILRRALNGLIPGQPNKKENIGLVDQDTGIPVPEEKTADFTNQYTTHIEPFVTNIQEVSILAHEINVSKSSAIDNVSSKILKLAFTYIS